MQKIPFGDPIIGPTMGGISQVREVLINKQTSNYGHKNLEKNIQHTNIQKYNIVSSRASVKSDYESVENFSTSKLYSMVIKKFKNLIEFRIKNKL